jgi:hypothetical protein
VQQINSRRLRLMKELMGLSSGLLCHSLITLFKRLLELHFSFDSVLIRPFLKLNLPTTLQGRKALRPYEAVTSLQEIA